MRITKMQSLAVAILLTCSSALSSQIEHKDREILVSTDWLEGNLSDSLLVVLHYGMKTEFKKEHIPGARYVSIWDILVKTEQGLRHELPREKDLTRVLRSWGLNNNSRILICYQDGNAITMAARLYYTLDYAGLGEQVSMLNGGLKAWKEEGRAISQDITDFEKGNIDIRIKDSVRISKEEVLASLGKKDVAIIDARPVERYYGTEQDTNSDRQGHIPGAVNIPYFQVTREGFSHLFKTKEELHQLFSDYKIPEGASLITYCGTGIWASPLYFTAKLLGYPVRFYDGSFQEWGNDEALPVDSLVIE